MVVLISAVGVSGSGKTTTIEFLISNLVKEGHNIGAVKHIHRENFTIDKEGTNTWRFSKAGSRITVAVSPEEIAIIEKTKASLNELDRIIQYLKDQGVDVIFIEGFHEKISKRPDIFKIITGKTEEDLERTIKNASAPILAITGIIAKSGSRFHEVPYIDLPNQGEQLLKIVRKCLATSQN